MKNAAGRVLVAATGGLCLAPTFPRVSWWPLAFVAFPLLLASIRGARPLAASAAGFVFGIIGLGVPARWAPEVVHASGGSELAGALLVLGLAASTALFAALHAFAQRSGRGELLAPFLWVAIEAVRGAIPALPLPWFLLGHSIGVCLPLCQAARLLGTAGLSFLVALSGTLVERAIEERRRVSRMLALLALGAGLPIIVWELGFFVLVSAVPVTAFAHGSLSVVVVQDERTVEAKTELSLKGMLKARRDLTPKVDVILWPLGAWPESAGDPVLGTGVLRPELARVARLAEYAFVFGCRREGRNAAVVAAPDGRVLGIATERGPAIFPESGPPVTGKPVVVRARYHRVGVAVGLGAGRDESLREVVDAGATIILVLAGEPFSWPWDAHVQHAIPCATRACELGCPIVRASSSGVTFALDDLGRPCAAARGALPDVVLARVHGFESATFFRRHGWRFPQLALLASVLGLAGPAAQAFFSWFAKRVDRRAPRR